MPQRYSHLIPQLQNDILNFNNFSMPSYSLTDVFDKGVHDHLLDLMGIVDIGGLRALIELVGQPPKFFVRILVIIARTVAKKH